MATITLLRGWDRIQAEVVDETHARDAQGRVWTRQGDPRAEAALDESLRLAEPTGELQYIGPVQAARAERAWWAGEFDTVFADVLSVVDLTHRFLPAML